MAHEGQSQHLENIMSLLVHGIEIGADDAEILCTFEGPKAAGYFLLYFGHPDGALAQIIGKRELHAPFWEGLEVQFLRPTRPGSDLSEGCSKRTHRSKTGRGRPFEHVLEARWRRYFSAD